MFDRTNSCLIAPAHAWSVIVRCAGDYSTNVIYHVANHQIGEELISLLRMIAPVASGFRTIIYRVVFDRTSLLHLFIA